MTRLFNFRKALSLRSTPDYLVERYRILTSRELPPPAPSWPLAPEQLAGIQLRWPSQYNDPATRRFVRLLEEDLAKRVDLEVRPIPQPVPLVARFEIQLKGATYRCGIDVSDRPALDERAVASCDLLFKYQFADEGYPHPHVVPGGYVEKDAKLYALLPQLRRLRDRHDERIDVHGRFSWRRGTEIRERAHRLLAGQRRFGFVGSLEKVMYYRYLREIARSRICIDMPGDGALCYRLIDYLSIGACIIGPRPAARLPVPLEDGVHMVFCRPDLSDLLELCERYLDDTEARRRLIRGSRDYFDRYLHRAQHADYVLTCCLAHHERASRGA